MKVLSIFDDNVKIATISILGDNAFIFARSSREWCDVKRWIDQGFYRLDKDTDLYERVNPQDKNFLELLADRAQSFDFNTEIINDRRE